MEAPEAPQQSLSQASKSPTDQKLLVISNHNSGNDSSSSGNGRLHVARSDTQPIFKVEKVSSNGNSNSNGNISGEEDNKTKEIELKLGDVVSN